MLDVDPEDLPQVATANDQKPVQALGADRPHPALRVRVRPGRLHGRQEHLGTVRAEHIVEAAGELRVPSAQQPALTVEVTGFQWSWRFAYAGTGADVLGGPGTIPEMVLAVGQPVHIELTTAEGQLEGRPADRSPSAGPYRADSMPFPPASHMTGPPTPAPTRWRRSTGAAYRLRR